MADTISLEDISARIDSADYSDPVKVEELKQVLQSVEATYAVSNQYDQFIKIRQKYEEKTRTPENSSAAAEHSSDQRSFDELKGNQARREYLEDKINREGDLVLTPVEQAFLAEQLVNGHMYDQLQDGEKILKIAQALGNEKLEQSLRDNVMRQLDKSEQSATPADNVFLPSNANAFGEQIMKDIASAGSRDAVTDLQRQVDLLAANVEAYGNTDGNMSARRKLIDDIQKLQDASKGLLNFNNRRKLNNQLKKIDPDYYANKTVQASSLSAPYYRARAKLRDFAQNRRSQKIDRLKDRHEKITTLQDVIHESPFWSMNMGRNISARFQLMGNCLREGRFSAQGVTNKYAKQLDMSQSGAEIGKIDAELSSLKTMEFENPISRAQNARRIQMLEVQKEAFEKQSEKLSERRKNKLDKVNTQITPAQQKIRERLEKMAEKLETSRLEALQTSQKFQALSVLQSRSGLSAEQKKHLDAIVNGLTEKAITAENIYDKILQAEGYSESERKAKIAELFPAREAVEEPQKPQEQILEAEREKENTDARTEEIARSNNVVTHEERRGDEVITKYESGLEVSRPDENTYNISGKNGSSPTDEQCAEFVSQLKADNYNSFRLDENITPEFYLSMVNAAEKAGMIIENQKEIAQKFAKQTNLENVASREGENAQAPHQGTAATQKSSFMLERRDDGDILLTKAQLMALNAEGRLDMGGLNRYYDENGNPLPHQTKDENGNIVPSADGKKGLTFAELSSDNKAYLEELGLGEQHIQDALIKEAKENKGLTGAQREALDAEGRLDTLSSNGKDFNTLSSQDKAYLDAEGLGKNYNRKVERNQEFMAKANISAKDITVEKMDLLVKVQDMNKEEYEKFKTENPEYKKLPARQRKLVDAVNGLKNNQEFKSKDDKKQAVILGRIVGQYKASVEKEGAKNDKKARQRILDHNITRHLAQSSRSNG